MKEILIEKAKEVFSNTREKCPSMSEEIYEIIDYLSVVINDKVDPNGLLMTTLCIQDDIQNERCGFNQAIKLPEYLIENKNEVLSQIPYIVQIVDQLTPEEFSSEFRKLYKKITGSVVPIKVNIDEEYPEYVTVAADWWVNAIQEPKFNNGAEIDALSIIFSLVEKKEYSHEELRTFKKCLSSSIQKQVESTGRCKLYVDYNACEMLETAGNLIEVDEKIGFPWKTTMYITKDSVDLISYNYGEGKNLYSNKGKKFLKCSEE